MSIPAIVRDTQCRAGQYDQHKREPKRCRSRHPDRRARRNDLVLEDTGLSQMWLKEGMNINELRGFQQLNDGKASARSARAGTAVGNAR